MDVSQKVLADPHRLLLSFELAVLLVPLIGFPAEIVNQTAEENEAEIRRWFRWVPNLRRPNLPPWVQLSIFGLVAAVLLVVVDGKAGFDRRTLIQVIGFLVAVPLVTLVFEAPGELYARRCGRHPVSLRVLPPALIFAGLAALLSRLVPFDPPYVYGLVAAYFGAHGVRSRREEGRGALASAGCLLGVSVLAWSVWIPVKDVIDKNVVEHGQVNFGLLLLDGVLVSVFILGLETAVFAMVPMTFLTGAKVYGWKRRIWAAAYLPVLFLFIVVAVFREAKKVDELAKNGEELTPAAVAKMLGLFLFFAVLSIVFWAYFRYRPASKARLRDDLLRLALLVVLPLVVVPITLVLVLGLGLVRAWQHPVVSRGLSRRRRPGSRAVPVEGDESILVTG